MHVRLHRVVPIKHGFAFGIGLLASFFLPTGWLVVIEAIVIIGVGFLYFSVK